MVNKQQFLDSLKPLTCDICYEEFDSTHAPVELPGCGHIFGEECIALVVESATQEDNNNKCPKCRRVLFEHDEVHPYLESDEASSDSFNESDNQPVADSSDDGTDDDDDGEAAEEEGLDTWWSRTVLVRSPPVVETPEDVDDDPELEDKSGDYVPDEDEYDDWDPDSDEDPEATLMPSEIGSVDRTNITTRCLRNR